MPADSRSPMYFGGSMWWCTSMRCGLACAGGLAGGEGRRAGGGGAGEELAPRDAAQAAGVVPGMRRGRARRLGGEWIVLH